MLACMGLCTTQWRFWVLEKKKDFLNFQDFNPAVLWVISVSLAKFWTVQSKGFHRFLLYIPHETLENVSHTGVPKTLVCYGDNRNSSGICQWFRKKIQLFPISLVLWYTRSPRNKLLTIIILWVLETYNWLFHHLSYGVCKYYSSFSQCNTLSVSR